MNASINASVRGRRGRAPVHRLHTPALGEDDQLYPRHRRQPSCLAGGLAGLIGPPGLDRVRVPAGSVIAITVGSQPRYHQDGHGDGQGNRRAGD